MTSNSRHTQTRWFTNPVPLLLICVLALAGCSSGGGGGGGAAPPVTPVAPAGLTYPAAGMIFENVAMTPLSPTLATGSADSYSVAPALPAGIMIDATTGVISGTPTAIAALATYTITATNTEGSTTFDLDLEVLPVVVPDVEFAAASSSTPENSASVSVVVSLSAATINDVTVSVAATGTATVGADYTAPAATLTIAAGQTSGTVDIALIDDAVAEGPETIILTLSAPIDGNLGAITVHTVTLVDDEGAPTVNFATAAQSVPEDAGTAAIEVTLVPASTSAITVTLQLVGAQTTADGADFTIANFDLVFAPGDTSQMLTVTVIDDALFEGDETVALNLASAPGAAIGTVDQTILTIGENDPEPTAEFAAVTFGLLEIDAPLDLTVTLSAVSSFDRLDHRRDRRHRRRIGLHDHRVPARDPRGRRLGHDHGHADRRWCDGDDGDDHRDDLRRLGSRDRTELPGDDRPERRSLRSL